MDITSFQFPGETSWRHPWFQAFSHPTGYLWLFVLNVSRKQPLRIATTLVRAIVIIYLHHHTSHLTRISAQPLPHFSGQSSLVKTWVLFQRCTVASHLKQSKTQSPYNSYHSPRWSSPILTVFPDISLLFCLSGMSLQAVPLDHSAPASLAFLLPFLFLEYMRDLCINTHYSFDWNTFSQMLTVSPPLRFCIIVLLNPAP